MKIFVHIHTLFLLGVACVLSKVASKPSSNSNGTKETSLSIKFLASGDNKVLTQPDLTVPVSQTQNSFSVQIPGHNSTDLESVVVFNISNIRSPNSDIQVVSALQDDDEREGDKSVGYARIRSKSVKPAPNLPSDCGTVLEGCLEDKECRELLDPVLRACHNNCNREKCMKNIRFFYQYVDQKWSEEVAFCVCKKTHSATDDCLIAQEKLHPSCARRPSTDPLLCSKLAQSCRNNRGCRHRLDFYEQACAVDRDTKRCQGSVSECRRALLGILGTTLRNICTCTTASNPTETYDCLDWQKILWFNPCVVEAQVDYHKEMLGELEPDEKLTTSGSIIWVWSTSHSGRISIPAHITTYYPLINIGAPADKRINESEINRSVIEEEKKRIVQRIRPTLPPDFCTKDLPYNETDDIPVGSMKRYYNTIESCSELCQCFIGKKLICQDLECVPQKACMTNDVVYGHNSPTYKAYRGRCLCYSESFICARPEYERGFELGEGTYLSIGYSKKEEELLKSRTNRTVSDTIEELQTLYLDMQDGQNQSLCFLQTYSRIDENVVYRVISEDFIEDRGELTPLDFQNEMILCKPNLDELSQMINGRHPLAYQNAVLSMILVSEVQINIPEISSCPHNNMSWTISILCFSYLTICQIYLYDNR